MGPRSFHLWVSLWNCAGDHNSARQGLCWDVVSRVAHKHCSTLGAQAGQLLRVPQMSDPETLNPWTVRQVRVKGCEEGVE